ncbi:MAG: lycopene cyclase domain-containing protein, partial [Cytophagaceae bacterium]|nr:lycopene cyclase domain-containing protein [Cytophagaceae bacterium]
VKNTFSERTENIFTLILIIVLIISGILCYEKAYTIFTFLGLAFILTLGKYILKIKWLAKFYIIYILLLFPFLIVNGILTGTGLEQPIVWYNHTEIIGIRILTIPMEDVFYGMALILMNMLIYMHLLKRSAKEVIPQA